MKQPLCRTISCCALIGLLAACSRAHYRTSADEEVTQLVAATSHDPRWALKGLNIGMDPRSRFFDATDPDYPPMPPDDPASHELMPVSFDERKPAVDPRKVDAELLENPGWRASLADDLESTPDGKLKLPLEAAMRISLRHSPSYQQQLESIYLSALDVSTERFRFDVQFFGSVVPAYQHRGSLNPGGESNTVTMDSEATAQKQFSTAGELLVSFVNTIGWQFFGPNDGFTMSQLSFSFLQPLLRGGGRTVALEQLTIAERTLLANLRALQQYRQGFYTQVAIGQSGVAGPQRRGGFFGGTGLTGFTGQGSGGFGGVGDVTGFGRGSFGAGAGGGSGGGAGFAGGGAGTVGGFIGLLQQTQQIRNTRDSLNLQLRTLALLESNLDAGLIDIAQVDQFRQNIETERANLLQAQNSLEASLDTFNRSVLGLPPDIAMEPDDSLIRPFQLIDPAMTAVQDALADFIDDFGQLPAEPDLESLRRALDGLEPLRKQVSGQLDAVPHDLQELDGKMEARERSMTDAERRLFEADTKRLPDDLRQLRERFDATGQSLEQLRAGLAPGSAAATADGIVNLLNELANIVGELSLVQARARLEAITVEPIELTSQAALEIARSVRLDWMNNRAALVDTWRLIEFNANALQAGLNLRLNGEIPTVGDSNPVNFKAKAGTLRAAIEFDGPFTRLVERNNFRQQLIQYQQDRRQLIQFEDGIHQTLRQTLRTLEQLRVNLEIQRRAVTIAIRRVDQTREALNRPVPPNAPGQAPQALGPTAAQNLLFALSDLRNTQNNLMSVWLNYLAARMQLYRELGILKLDEHGLWVDEPLEDAIKSVTTGEPLPPAVPPEWLVHESTPDAKDANISTESEAQDGDRKPN